MTSSILFAGQEDLSFTVLGPGYTTLANTNGVVINTTANRFRAGYGRYALDLHGNGAIANNLFLRAFFAATTEFWWTARLAIVQSNSGTVAAEQVWILNDSSNVARLRLRGNNTASNWFTVGANWTVEKVNAAHSATVLGSGLSGGFSNTPSTPDKLDVFVNYAVAGELAIYINGVQVFDFVGDVTTDSVTTLASLDLGVVTTGSSNQNTNAWSEVIVATRSTQNMSLVTQAPAAPGNSDTFTIGGFANVGGNQVNQSNPDFSETAAQVQQYEVSPAIPAGSFNIISAVQHGQCSLGPDGPQHIDFCVRTGGADFFTTDMLPSSSWGLLTFNWDSNPNTAAPWTVTDLAASSSTFNIGYRSTT